MPKFLIYSGLVLIVLALIPPAVIARMRAKNTDQRRIHYIQDMDNQVKLRAQHASPSFMIGEERTFLFEDQRGMRPLIPGTIARGELQEDDAYYRGFVRGVDAETGLAANQWVDRFPAPVEVDMALMERGRERFDIFCQPCHGLAGYGDGIINKRAMELQATGVGGTTWVQAKSLHDQDIREQPIGQLFNTITNGVRTMAGYASQIPVDDRWAIVAYVTALQRSQHAHPGDVDSVSELPLVKLPPQEETGQ